MHGVVIAAAQPWTILLLQTLLSGGLIGALLIFYTARQANLRQASATVRQADIDARKLDIDAFKVHTDAYESRIADQDRVIAAQASRLAAQASRIAGLEVEHKECDAKLRAQAKAMGELHREEIGDLYVRIRELERRDRAH
jgi:hypothetical protein